MTYLEELKAERAKEQRILGQLQIARARGIREERNDKLAGVVIARGGGGGTDPETGFYLR